MFLACLKKVAAWMFAMDHVDYARWLPVFINDLKALQKRHPNVYREFMAGKFTISQSGKPFSRIGIDQALTKWMVAGPEIADMVKGFRENDSEEKEIKHHEDTKSFENRFRKDVVAFCNSMKELGNPFRDTDNNLVSMISKNIMNDDAVASVSNAASIGEPTTKISL